MAASGKPGWDDLFPPHMEGFRKVPFGELGAMERAVGDDTVAILVEPIQGEAGVITPPAGYLRGLRELADRAGVLLVFDEVQTGVGRTGDLFAFQSEEALPDVLTLGKGLGGGIPVAALLARSNACCFEHGDQGGTFNGNPLVTAVAGRILDVVTGPGFLEHVRRAGDHLAGAVDEALGKSRLVEVRGRGLLRAAVLRDPAAFEIRDGCFTRGLLVNASRPNVLRFMPSLRVTIDEIDEMARVLREVTSSLE
jgi:acetylornithine/N-succinyldiaminopimelate aminotransferase